MKKEIPYKIYLHETELPTAWYNLRAFMKNKPAPLLHPITQKPMTEEDLSKVFCRELRTFWSEEANQHIVCEERWK